MKRSLLAGRRLFAGRCWHFRLYTAKCHWPSANRAAALDGKTVLLRGPAGPILNGSVFVNGAAVGHRQAHMRPLLRTGVVVSATATPITITPGEGSHLGTRAILQSPVREDIAPASNRCRKLHIRRSPCQSIPGFNEPAMAVDSRLVPSISQIAGVPLADNDVECPRSTKLGRRISVMSTY